jgi:predicted nucleotidyltransferase component of viral defense system
MNLNDLHRRLLQDVLEIGNDVPLVITGGYAVQAHQIVDRFSRDIDMATDSMVAMEAIVATVVEGLTGRGWTVEIIGVDPHSARMMTTDAGSGEQCELDILRETFSRPPEITPYGPVLALDDVIGTKVRALAGRGLPRDLIDIHAAARLRTTAELEALGRRHAWEDEFSLEDLKFRLDGADWYDDQAFAEYGLTAQEINSLRCWAQSWSDDINRRLYAENYVDDEDEEIP